MTYVHKKVSVLIDKAPCKKSLFLSNQEGESENNLKEHIEVDLFENNLKEHIDSEGREEAPGGVG